MMRRVAVAAFAVLIVATFAFSEEAKEAKGKVKSVSGNTVTVTSEDGKDWGFEASKESVVVAEGASHKMDALDAEGKPKAIGEFVKEKQSVTVKYWDKDGKLFIKELRVH